MILPLSFRSPRASGSVLCLRYLRRPGVPALPVRTSLHSGERCQRSRFWLEGRAESVTQEEKGAHGRSLWWRRLRHLLLSSPYTVLPFDRRLQPGGPDRGTGWTWHAATEAQRRHVATARLQSLRHSQGYNVQQSNLIYCLTHASLDQEI